MPGRATACRPLHYTDWNALSRSEYGVQITEYSVSYYIKQSI